MMELRYVPIVAGNYIGSGRRSDDKKRDLCSVWAGMEHIGPGEDSQSRIHMSRMQEQAAEEPGKKAPGGERRKWKAAVVSAVLVICLYMICARLAYLERGYAAYGGECLAPLVIGWIVYGVMRGGTDREKDLLYLPKVRVRHGSGRGQQLSGVWAYMRRLPGRIGRLQGEGNRNKGGNADACRDLIGEAGKTCLDGKSPCIITGDDRGMLIRAGMRHGYYNRNSEKSQMIRRRCGGDQGGAYVP